MCEHLSHLNPIRVIFPIPSNILLEIYKLNYHKVVITTYKQYIPNSNILLGDKMVLCYHKEVFELGVISGLILSTIITIFEDVIDGQFEEFKKFIGV